MFTVLSIILVIIGAINWFSVGVFDFNIVEYFFNGDMYIGAQIIYGLVGVAGMWLLIYLLINKFSPKRINAPDCISNFKDRKSNCRTCDEHDVTINDEVRG